MFKYSKKVTELQEDVRKWTACPNDGYVGTTVLIIDKEDVICKLLYTVAFTTSCNKPTYWQLHNYFV